MRLIHSSKRGWELFTLNTFNKTSAVSSLVLDNLEQKEFLYLCCRILSRSMFFVCRFILCMNFKRFCKMSVTHLTCVLALIFHTSHSKITCCVMLRSQCQQQTVAMFQCIICQKPSASSKCALQRKSVTSEHIQMWLMKILPKNIPEFRLVYLIFKPSAGMCTFVFVTDQVLQQPETISAHHKQVCCQS